MMAPGNRASQQTARGAIRLQTSPPLREPAGLGTRLLPIRVTSKIPSCLVACAIYAALGAVDTSPVAALLRRRVPWRSWEMFNVLVPFCAWTGLMSSGLSTGSKRLSNLSLEPAMLATAPTLGASARVAMSTSNTAKAASAPTLVGPCFVAATTFWIVAALPE